MADEVKQNHEADETETPDNAVESTTSGDDIDDISLDDPQPVAQKRRGCSPLTTLIVLIIIAVAAFFAYSIYAKQQQEALERENRARQAAARQAQLSQVGNSIAVAIYAAERGDITEALNVLEKAENNLSTIARVAVNEGDQTAADYVNSKRQSVSAARKAIKDAYAVFQETVSTQCDTLRTTFKAEAGDALAPREEAALEDDADVANGDDAENGELPDADEAVTEETTVEEPQLPPIP